MTSRPWKQSPRPPPSPPLFTLLFHFWRVGEIKSSDQVVRGIYSPPFSHFSFTSVLRSILKKHQRTVVSGGTQRFCRHLDNIEAFQPRTEKVPRETSCLLHFTQSLFFNVTHFAGPCGTPPELRGLSALLRDGTCWHDRGNDRMLRTTMVAAGSRKHRVHPPRVRRWL